MTRLQQIERAVGPRFAPSSAVLDRLDQFAQLVAKWNPSINVVAKSTVSSLWERHILDSLQVFRCADSATRTWVDLGSGGGFPGIVVAILAADVLPDLRVSLVESDRRKAVFLSEVIRHLRLSASVHAVRIEDLPAQNADVVSARALAPLAALCGLALRHLRTGGTCAFLKGAQADAEIFEARKIWRFDLDRSESVTDSRSSILFLKGLAHV